MSSHALLQISKQEKQLHRQLFQTTSRLKMTRDNTVTLITLGIDEIGGGLGCPRSGLCRRSARGLLLLRLVTLRRLNSAFYPLENLIFVMNKHLTECCPR